MRAIAKVARILLGLIFVVFGANNLLHFIPVGVAGQFTGLVFATGYFHVATLFDLAGGILLLVNRYVPLGLTLLAPALFNILIFLSLFVRSGLPMQLLIFACWLLVAWRVRAAFLPLFRQRATD